jgi:hypothetical protein
MIRELVPNKKLLEYNVKEVWGLRKMPDERDIEREYGGIFPREAWTDSG